MSGPCPRDRDGDWCDRRGSSGPDRGPCGGASAHAGRAIAEKGLCAHPSNTGDRDARRSRHDRRTRAHVVGERRQRRSHVVPAGRPAPLRRSRSRRRRARPADDAAAAARRARPPPRHGTGRVRPSSAARDCSGSTASGSLLTIQLDRRFLQQTATGAAPAAPARLRLRLLQLGRTLSQFPAIHRFRLSVSGRLLDEYPDLGLRWQPDATGTWDLAALAPSPRFRCP